MADLLDRLRNRLGDEGGWALVTAMILMGVMLSLGLASLSIVDTQQQTAGIQRQKDSAFNLAEAALNAEVFALSNQWPASSGSAFPTCTEASNDTRCPNVGVLLATLPSPDLQTGASWQVKVLDNGVNSSGQSSASFFSDAITNAPAGPQPAYDANADGKIWIRAQATAKGHTRTVVSLVQVQNLIVGVPQAVLISGSVHTSNNGNKALINTLGSAPTPGSILVRCHRADPGCISIGKSRQISPDTTCDVDNCSVPGPTLSATAQAALKAKAIAAGTFYSTCPNGLPDGGVIWIDSGNCSYTGNGSTTEQLLIINNGTMEFSGNSSFYGVVYGLNAQGSTDTNSCVICTHGNGHIYGAVFIDGGGAFEAGSSHENLTWDPNALSTLSAYGKAIELPDSFRELPGH